MTITQTVNIPENHKLLIDVPREVPEGVTNVVIQFPIKGTPVKETVVKRRMSEAEEIEYINNNIEWLTREAMENLSYQSLPKSMLTDYVGTLSDVKMEDVNTALRIALAVE